MTKLFNLKKWLTLEEAASYLSAVFSESVKNTDLLQLALDKQLTLSIDLVNLQIANLGTLTPPRACQGLGLPATKERQIKPHWT